MLIHPKKLYKVCCTYLLFASVFIEGQKEGLLNKSRSFAASANRGQYPELYYEENTKGGKKYLNQ